jgi:hypothetical protein
MNAKSLIIASAAATLFLTGAVVAHAEEKMGGDMVRCMGINECKGHGSCATAHNACNGQNGCKGQGISKVSAADCKEKGGTVAPAPEKK